MPHLGDYAAREAMRADLNFRRVPMLLFSAATREGARTISLRRCRTEALAKPFDPAQLRGAIRLRLGQRP
jgi:CheY-like chemotaxis protein